MSKDVLCDNLATFYRAVDSRALELAGVDREFGQQLYEGAVLGVSIPLCYRNPESDDQMLVPLFREGFIYHGREDVRRHAVFDRQVLSPYGSMLTSVSLPLIYNDIAQEGRPNNIVMSPWRLVEERADGIADDSGKMSAFYDGVVLSLTHLMTGRPLDGSLTHFEREHFLKAAQSNIYSSAIHKGYDSETHMRGIIEDWDHHSEAMSLKLATVQSENAGEELDFDDFHSLQNTVLVAAMERGDF